MNCLWGEDITQISPSGLTDWVLQEKKQSHRIYNGRLSNLDTPVSLKVLETNTEKSKTCFLHEAVLYNLLDHKNLPSLKGVATLPLNTLPISENKRRSLPVIVLSQFKGPSLSTFLQTAYSRKYQRKHNPYDELLDILIDVADALHYLHKRRPMVVHRAISMSTITVVQTKNGVQGVLNDLSHAQLMANPNRRLKRFDSDAFSVKSVVGDQMLTLDIFIEPSECTPSMPASPRKTPQKPLKFKPISSTSSKKLGLSSSTPVKHKKIVRTKGETKPVILSTKNAPPIPPVPKPKPTDGKRCEMNSLSDIHSTTSTRGAFKAMDSNKSYALSSSASSEAFASTSECTSIPTHGPSDSATSRIHVQKRPCKNKIDELKRTGSLQWTSDDLSNPLDKEDALLLREDSIVYIRDSVGALGMAPEMINSDVYGPEVDVFGLGVVIYSALTKRAPLSLFGKPSVYRFIYPENFPRSLRLLISECCAVDVKVRPSMAQIADRLRKIKDSSSFKALYKRRRYLFSCFGDA